ncbi:hypothetical protein LIQ91_01080 [Ruminococcus callidus]|nr:hypothetical protein [Ruminococcus callidus]
MTDFSVVRPTIPALMSGSAARNFVAFADALYLSQQSWQVQRHPAIGLNRVSPRFFTTACVSAVTFQKAVHYRSNAPAF